MISSHTRLTGNYVLVFYHKDLYSTKNKLIRSHATWKGAIPLTHIMKYPQEITPSRAPGFLPSSAEGKLHQLNRLKHSGYNTAMNPQVKEHESHNSVENLTLEVG